jgi:hypothetical protein
VEAHHRIALGRWWIGAFAALGFVYALLASFTRPFTGGADVVTAVPLVIAVLVLVRSTSERRRSQAREPGVGEIDAVPTRERRGIVWAAPILAGAGWELYCLVNLPRAAHPTLSSLIDILDATRAGKTVAFASWLVLGWFLVTA